MAKYVICGDLQLQHSNKDKVKSILNQIKSYNLPTIFLGDMLDKRGLIEADCLNLLYDYFYSLSDTREDTNNMNYIICGNHDKINITSEESALSPLSSLENVILVDKPFNSIIDKELLFVPYYRDPNEFIKAINDKKYENTKYLFCHQGVKEFTLSSGYSENEAVDLKDLKKFKLVVAGHYHTPQEKENVVYLGSPFSHSFGESNERKRIAIFDDKDGSLEYIETYLPRHITMEIDVDHHLEIGSPVYDFDPNHYTRVILKGKKTSIDQFPKDKYPFVKFIEEPTIEYSRSLLRETQTPKDMFDKWYKEIKKETDEELYQLGIDILKN